MDVRISIPLTPNEIEKLMRPIRGQGGFQTFLQNIQGQLQEGSLRLGLEDVRKIIRYRSKYGGGGFQDRLGAVLSALDRLKNAL